MYISRAKWESKNGKVYESVWLRHSYREGRKVRKRSIANLTHCPPEEVAAIELALKHKGDLAVLGSLKGVKIEEGLSVGAVWTVYEVARALGIEKVLGRSRAGKLALWQVLARVLEQGSRLSAVRLAQLHAACDVLGMRRGFSENDLYENLAWLSERQNSIERWISVKAEGRTLRLELDENALEQAARLDGCYVIKTDLPKTAAGTQTIHDRYKQLSLVEQAFRTCKTAHLEVRPIFVRNEPSTRGHVLVVMLAYLIRRELSRAWTSFDLTVEEALERLKTLCSTKMSVARGASCLRIPTPRPESRRLLKALNIRLPEILPHSPARVVTHKKLPQRRKKRSHQTTYIPNSYAFGE